MSSDSMQTLPDPVLRSKMPLFDTTIASTGLTKSQNMSGFLGKQALQYNGSCFTYDPREKEGAGLTSPWRTNSKASLLDARSPVTHLSGTERQNHIIYRQGTSSSEEGHSNSSSMHHAPVKQGFMLYAKSPEISSPTPAIRKQTKAGSEDSSSHSENSVYLAIPKPVYRHNPCCNELGCMIGQRYTVEHGSPRIPNTIYEHDWMQSEAHYIERSPLQRKAQDALLQQRGLHFEAGTEPLKRITVEPYSPGKARTLSLEPNYSSYPCAPTHTLFGSLSEHSQPLQTSPRGYPSLYPSQPTYEHMTSEVYQEHSLIPKYGQLAQHPMFYYPQANVEVENRQQCKDSGSKQREDVPVIHKHTISNPRERYIVPQPLHAEIPLPTAEMLQNHPFIQRFDYPCYAIQRFHLNASQIRPPLKRPNMSPSFHPSHINVSPSSQPHPAASDTSLHKDKSSIGLQAKHFHDSPFLRMDQISPTRRASQHAVSPSSLQIGRYFSPLTSLHMDPPIPPPAGLNINKLLDYSSCEAQVTCPKQLQSLPVSRAAWLPHSPKHSADRIHTAAHNSANVRKIIYSPAVATGSKHNGSVTSPGNGVHKGSLKRSIFHSSAPMKIKEEDNDVYEVEVSKKPKLEMEDKNDSPPMPIIDTVFSLAPYQACLRTSGVFIPGRAPQTAFQHSEHHEIKPSTDIKRKGPDRDENHSAASVGSKDTCPEDTPTEQTAVEPKHIKVEKVDSLDMGDAVETCVGENDCIKVTIKKEAEETDVPDSEPVVLKVKCEPDELENEPSLANENQTLDESKHAALPAQVSSLSHGDAYTQYQQAVTLQPQTTAPPQPHESKVDFKNIPPQCLKLSTYNIIIPDIKHYSPAPLPEKPVALLVPKPTAKQQDRTPVRKHFFELHHSLCTLVSKAVSASAEHELKNWLSQLQINEPVSPSTKVQKVSCLLGVKAREVWVNEEMKKALNNVLERLREYTTQERCPFPHVMRTGAVFIPMLVVKELLFPMVQGNFIDQVLQEHKVELRPTTLSEEKILIQLHKRACSSRLRRLMSLKHLPDVYADVVNLLHYTCVCKHLGLDTDPHYREQDGGCEASNSRGAPVFAEIIASSDTPSYMKDQETQLHLNRNRTKSRVKSSSRRMFLDDTLSDQEEAGNTVGGVGNTFTKKNWVAHEPQGTEDSGTDHMVAEQDSPLIQQAIISENSWTCPLSFNALSPSDTEEEAEESSSLWPVSQSSGPANSQARSKNCSGVILKLRKMLSKSRKSKKARYQAVPESETFADPSLSQTGEGEGGSSETDPTKRTPEVTHKWQRTGSFPHALRPLAGSPKRKNRSRLKIKYCPYLSACHSAEHRKRWVLRSAVQRARTTMRFYYPDLVGKRIHHLYEEDDKSEVWYRGEVLRIHEAHTNPLKTIFEVRYDSEPEWKYYLELLIDYKKGWLKIEE